MIVPFPKDGGAMSFDLNSVLFMSGYVQGAWFLLNFLYIVITNITNGEIPAKMLVKDL